MKFTEFLSIVLALGIGILLGIWGGFLSSDIGKGGQCLLQKEDLLAAAVYEKRNEDVKIPIAVYHSVRPYIRGESAYQDRFDVTPELLEEHLKYAKENGFTAITFSQLADFFDNGTPLPEKPIIFSFDDSWKNQYEYAFPLLKKYETTGTFFVFTNSLGRGIHLTWDEVKEMQKAGMEIGSHTKTHPYLDNITDPEELKKEIADSKKILEDELGVKIDSFAYPFGEHATSSMIEVEKAGYGTARALKKGVIQNIKNRYSLSAFLVTDNFNDFVKMLNK